MPCCEYFKIYYTPCYLSATSIQLFISRLIETIQIVVSLQFLYQCLIEQFGDLFDLVFEVDQW